EDPVRFNLG
nr:RecName: Full=65 kDa cell wall protein [Phaseolus vulgaris]